MDSPKNEYRCTRSALYRHKCFGQYNLGARQGHYVVASSWEEAFDEMNRRFPGDDGDFTIEICKENILNA